MKWPFMSEAEFDRRLAVELAERDASRRAVGVEPAAAAIPCTCGSVHFTAGGQVVTPRVDGREYPSGAVLSCVRCGRRWAHCGGELVEPHGKAMPPSWTAQDLYAAQQEASGARPMDPAHAGQLRGATRRASEQIRRAPR